MRNVNYSNALQASREVSASVRIVDKRLRFTTNTPTGRTAINFDVSYYNGNYYKIATFAGTSGLELHHCIQSDPSVAPTWTKIADIFPGSRPGLYLNEAFYQTTAGEIVYCNLPSASTYSLGTTKSVPAAIAPVNMAAAYIVTREYGATRDTSKRSYIKIERKYRYATHWMGGTTEFIWPGTIYDDDPTEEMANYMAPIVCAAEVTASDRIVDYLFVTDNLRKRTVYLASSQWQWGEVSPVIPMDIVDDSSSFVTSGANVINNQIVLTGIYKRKYGDPMHVYLFGPEFSLGRDLFITGKYLDDPGKMFLDGSTVKYIGEKMYATAPATELLGYSQTPFEGGDITNVQISYSSNEPYNGTLSLKSSASSSHIRSGAEIQISYVVGGQSSKIGTFTIERVLKTRTQSGFQYDISFKSSAMKALSQWESDSSLDFWSQTKVGALLSDNTKFALLSGSPQGGDNEVGPGHAYGSVRYQSVDKSSKSAELITRIYISSAVTGSSFSLSMNVSTGSGLKISHNAGSSAITIYDHLWNWIADISISAFPRDVWFWMMAKCVDGYLTLYTKSDTATSWTLLGEVSIKNTGYTANLEEGKVEVKLINGPDQSASYYCTSDSNFIPVADTQAFSTPCVVIVDNEQIYATSKTGSNSSSQPTGPLNYSLGVELFKRETVGSTVVNFANAQATAYLIQEFTITGSFSPETVQLWLKKVAVPEDGLTVRLYNGTVDGSHPLGTQLCETTIEADDIPEDGGWVTCKFTDRASLTTGKVWIVLLRNISANKPNGDHYYSSVLYNAGGSVKTYLFNELTDGWTEQTGNIPFRVFGRADEPGGTGCIMVEHHADLSHTNSFYNGFALTAISGTGAGQSFRINSYTHGDTICTFFIDRRVGLEFDTTTRFQVTPCIYGLTRGYNSTYAAPHDISVCAEYFTPPLIYAGLVYYFSSEMDMSLESITRKLCRKAGIKEIVANKIYPTSLSGIGNSVLRKNFVMKFRRNQSWDAADWIKIFARRSSSSSTDGVYLKFTNDTIGYYSETGDVLREQYACVTDPYLDYTVCIHENFLSVWLHGRYIHTFVMSNADAALIGEYAGAATSGVAFTIDWPEADMRVDNAIFDAGKRGTQILADIIGEKRFFYQDDLDGNLRLFRSRTEVNTADTPYPLAAIRSEEDSENGVYTRVQLEGAEVHEQTDWDALRDLGNIYHQENRYEINTETDAEYYTERALEDNIAHKRLITITGAFDPRIEPNDIVYVTTEDGVQAMVVETINVSITESSGDMVLSGYIKRSPITTP